jgi:ribosomal protein S18 acetylase RimI-like enzyme
VEHDPDFDRVRQADVALAAVDAACAAGADCIWLYADADDWPQELYRKLGFNDLGRTVTWTRWG